MCGSKNVSVFCSSSFIRTKIRKVQIDIDMETHRLRQINKYKAQIHRQGEQATFFELPVALVKSEFKKVASLRPGEIGCFTFGRLFSVLWIWFSGTHLHASISALIDRLNV